MGLYFEELFIGQRFGTELSDIIDTQKLGHYVQLTGDAQPSHVDSEYNKKFGYDKKFIAGDFILPLSEGLICKNDFYRVFMLRDVRLKFKKPLYVGDQIRVTDTIKSKNNTQSPHYGLVSIKRSIINQKGITIVNGSIEYLVEKKNHSL